MKYVHLDVTGNQVVKHNQVACGDVWSVERRPTDTLLLCCDGLGSGVSANLAATFCSARLIERLHGHSSLREAFGDVVRTMNQARGQDLPFAAFSLVRMLSDGSTTVLSYESPPTLLLTTQTATVLDQHESVIDHAVISEVNLLLEPGDALLVVSDGITQSGLGHGLPLGWGNDGLCRFVSAKITEGYLQSEIPRLVTDQARQLWGGRAHDDCTAVCASCRPGRSLVVLTGPPANPAMDSQLIKRYLALEGQKVVCGGTTAKLVARCSGQKLRVLTPAADTVAPPHYEISGVALVTEGAVTLNQVYNLIDESLTDYREDSGVTRLCELLRQADRIQFLVGTAPNQAEGDLVFRQQGILPRAKIVPLIAENLRNKGKLVIVEEV